jgi:hypothetical protein
MLLAVHQPLCHHCVSTQDISTVLSAWSGEQHLFAKGLLAVQDCVKAVSGLLIKLDSEGENSQYIQQIEALTSETVCPVLLLPISLGEVWLQGKPCSCSRAALLRRARCPAALEYAFLVVFLGT